MENVIQEKLFDKINFTYVNENKFKNTLVSVSFFTPLSKENVSKNAIIPDLLVHSCKKYPRLQDVSKKLEELYGASIDSGVSKLGESQVITVSGVCLSDEYAYESKENTLNLTKLMCEMIFNPDVQNNKFKKENVEQEKRQLIESILSELNDKKSYALRKCEEFMCKNEKFGINVIGNIKLANQLNGKNIFEAYKKLLESSQIEIMVIGNAPVSKIKNEFKEKFSKIERKEIENCDVEIIPKAEDVKNFKEEMNITQCKLVMGLRSEIAYPSSDVPAMILANAMFGATPQSKLFLNVREKLSLCYYCASSYSKRKGVMFIQSGVEKEKVEDAKKEILKQLKDLKIGNFTDEDIFQTKLYISQTLKSTEDSLAGLNVWYLCLEKRISPYELIDQIQNVTREKIIEVANKISLDTVYLLCPKKEEN